MFIGNRAVGERAGVKPMTRILAGAAVGVEPQVMGIGPAYAIPKALERAGLTLADIDIIEIHEAFAAQVLGCLKLMKVAFDDPRVNTNGGAIAIGHPLGASGARLALTAAREPKSQPRGDERGLGLLLSAGWGTLRNPSARPLARRRIRPHSGHERGGRKHH